MPENAQKNTLLNEAKEHITIIKQKIDLAVREREVRSETMAQNARRVSAGDAITERQLMVYNQEKIENLRQLSPSPYFTRCDFTINGEKKKMYFGKFSFSEEGIYSWITPVATLRFENPGEASYARTDGSKISGTIDRKDQYMIVDHKLLFFSTENREKPRELIYQEHFTRHKEGFVLPEVVELMEKAQDKVIRAAYTGPFAISGPAGSGKTTLALHRVAYLIQSPETMEFFSPESILVMVQDIGTKKYFSQLLPDLGIKGVAIVTFSEWACRILQLENYVYISDYQQFDKHRILYEYAKLQALRSLHNFSFSKNIYAELQKIYSAFFTAEQTAILNWQKKEKLLDRFDLTILLQLKQKQDGGFSVTKEYYQEMANGTYRKRKSSFPVQYNLAVIDEFQNYLPEQLALINVCMNKRLQSIVYVGDLAQQTQLGTIRSWESAGINVTQERWVNLQKVYRNTKEILNYIKNLGYSVAIPEQIKNGEPVQETVCKSIQEKISYISEHLNNDSQKTFGILARHKDYLTDFKVQFPQLNVHCLSYYEAQGVEFDEVFIVGVDESGIGENISDPKLLEELRAIEKDLLYVALTRAMSRLHVLGKALPQL